MRLHLQRRGAESARWLRRGWRWSRADKLAGRVHRLEIMLTERGQRGTAFPPRLLNGDPERVDGLAWEIRAGVGRGLGQIVRLGRTVQFILRVSVSDSL